MAHPSIPLRDLLAELRRLCFPDAPPPPAAAAPGCGPAGDGACWDAMGPEAAASRLWGKGSGEPAAPLAARAAALLRAHSFLTIDAGPPGAPEAADEDAFLAALPPAYDAWGAWLDDPGGDPLAAADRDGGPAEAVEPANMARGCHTGFRGWTHGVLAGCGGVITQEPGFYRTACRRHFHAFADDPDACAWPRPAALRPALRRAQRRLELLALLLLRLVAAAAPAADAALRRAALCRFLSVTDVWHYRPAAAPGAGAPAMRDHTDPGMLTLIPCAAVPALEIRDAAAGAWAAVERGAPAMRRIAVLCCDALQADTKECEEGAFPAARHRVQAPEATRVSIGYELRRFEASASRRRWFSAV